jgi:hypothetical protein
LRSISQALAIKASLIARGIDIPEPLSFNRFKPYIKALYDHDLGQTTFPYPQEIVLPVETVDGGVTEIFVHVRRTPGSRWILRTRGGCEAWIRSEDQEYPVKLPTTPPF